MTKMTKTLSVGSAGVDATVSVEIKPIPFRTELSLAPLLAFWARTFGDDTSLEGTFARTIREATEAAPELLAPITDPSVIDRHRKLVDMLMAAVFPAAVLDREYGAAIAPFQLRGFYATPPFEQLFLAADGSFHGRMNIEPSTLNALRLLRAYGLVLARVYSIELDLDYSFIFTVADPETGLDRHFKAQFDLRFVEVVPVGPTPPLTEEDRRRLRGNLLDRDFLLKILPPEKFVFRGFTILKAVEVTDQEVLSSLKRDLIDKESIVSNARFLALQQKLRTLFRRPELRFGLAALSGDQVLILNYGAKSEHACIFADSRHHTKEEFKGSVYERAVHQGSALAIEDLAAGAEASGQELEPIVFERVYPLYALSDIRGSSIERSLAIQADVLTQLRLARDVVQAAHAAKRLPALDELLYRVNKHAAKIEKSLNSGDEVGVVTFLRGDVERLFDHLQGFGPAVRERIEAYRAALDPRFGTVYARRRLFEESVTRIADTISSYLDLEEQTAQAMYPHYFEKQKTDGVDYQIYVGASLVEDGRFDPLYLKSLRLWQLMVTCGVALRTHQLRDRLAVPLEATHLVLVQHAPLSIRFRLDEKRFDVDGAYDIRYEIVKKRIDKALIRGASERVTQPGKIAIVYAQRAEANEYRGYIEYLQNLGYLTGEVEDLELDELQGVHGLHALRVTVDLRNSKIERRIAPGDLRAAAKHARVSPSREGMRRRSSASASGKKRTYSYSSADSRVTCRTITWPPALATRRSSASAAVFAPRW